MNFGSKWLAVLIALRAGVGVASTQAASTLPLFPEHRCQEDNALKDLSKWAQIRPSWDGNGPWGSVSNLWVNRQRGIFIEIQFESLPVLAAGWVKVSIRSLCKGSELEETARLNQGTQFGQLLAESIEFIPLRDWERFLAASPSRTESREDFRARALRLPVGKHLLNSSLPLTLYLAAEIPHSARDSHSRLHMEFDEIDEIQTLRDQFSAKKP